MTTIAYRDGVLAADTAATAGEAITGQISKVYDGAVWLIAVSGNAEDIPKAIRYIGSSDAVKEAIKFSDNFAALVIERATGKVMQFEGAEMFEVRAPFYARGSGRDFALGAMAAGATAAEAVEIACRYDCYSRAPVETVTL